MSDILVRWGSDMGENRSKNHESYGWAGGIGGTERPDTVIVQVTFVIES